MYSDVSLKINQRITSVVESMIFDFRFLVDKKKLSKTMRSNKTKFLEKLWMINWSLEHVKLYSRLHSEICA